MKHGLFGTIFLTAIVSSVVTIAIFRWNLLPEFSSSPPEAKVQAAFAARTGQPTLSPDEETNVRVYNKVSPGVVNITSMVVEYDFFFSPVAKEGATGSGCVLDTEGDILTNYHVIESAQSLEVSLPDQTKYRAALVGYDRQNDLAVIRIKASRERLHPVALGDSESLRVGQKVLAIGNPLGLQNTLTTGIISSLGRKIQTENNDLVDNVIQTDAAINPGNSGGPLLNTTGEMIGINTSIFTIGGGNIGIGFAIPASTIRRVTQDLITEGRVIRPWVGIRGYQINDDLASALDLPVTSGILVATVEHGSSMDNAGVRGSSEMVILYNRRVYIGGDIVTQVNGKPVASMEELRLALEGKKPGETVQITLFRGRSKIQKSVVLVEAPRVRPRS